ncbi:MAG: YihY family inner membrane protein [Proteobacteria bacterium]|jgi:membrane protein|nr:YihY family inner membrane protein [Pseudomonadota bacterium]
MPDPFRFVARVAARMREVDLGRAAASLSFTTLLAIVPLATVTVAFVARFPLFDEWLRTLEQFMIRHLLPFAAAAEVRLRVTEFADQAMRLSAISIAVIAATALLAIATVEREINVIWGVREGRPVARRLIVYTLGLTAGPVLIGASISLTTWLVVHSLAVVPIHRSAGERIVRALPFMFAFAGLTLLYKAAPARRVPWVAAAIAGALAAAALEAAKAGFAWYVTRVSTYQAVYGALSALPIFLIWVYLCWVIVLAGAAINATLVEPGGKRGRRGARSR